MKIQNSAGGRPPWYDRNPSDKSQFASVVGAAPHGFTARWSYTVPAARKAYVDTLYCENDRVTAAGTPGISSTLVTHLGTNPLTYFAGAQQNNNVAGALVAQNTGNSGVALAGAVITGGTADGSITGTVNYAVGAKITEFDA